MSNQIFENKMKKILQQQFTKVGDLKPFIFALLSGLSQQSKDYQDGFMAAMDLMADILEPGKDT